ncbi:unnamed protein product [Phytophthora fragariaefolia]|uniref:Unnamed protein product n=1 Tax=Phytophthora fragariaefolia TaxID=1490495 RepID=A0A9W6UA59_9STRA|nr:unnamed protein product [Phytophthora fragariaefolia]
MELNSKPARVWMDDSVLWTSVAVVYRECLLRRSGGQLPHVAGRIEAFLDDRSSSWSLDAVYDRTASLHCMQLVVDRRPAPESLYLEWEFNEVVARAARNGDLSSLKWLAESYCQDGSLSAAASGAASSGELAVLKWLHDTHKTRVHWGGLEWCEAIRWRQSEVIEWLRQNTAPHTEAVWKMMFDAAAAGYLELVQWMWEHNKSGVWSALRGAHRTHQWGVVKWLVTHCNVGPLDDCVEAAAKDGDLLFLRWLRAKGLAHSFTNALPISAASGQLETIKWLYEEAVERKLTTDCITQAAREGHLDVVKWLDARKCPATTAAMDEAASAGFLEVVQWLHRNRTEGCSMSAMNGAAENGHLDVVKWLHAERNEGCSVSAMEKAAGNGHLEVVQWLHSHRSEGCTERAMDWAAKGGHLNVVKWLSQNRSEGCTTAAMNWAAYGGHLGTIKWLHQNRCEGFTPKAMCLAASSGHLNVLRWLQANTRYSFSSDAVDMAAAGGHLHVLEWLHTNGVNTCSPSAMRDAVLGGHIPVMLFLLNNYGCKPCKEGICLLRDDWEDTEIRFVGMARWLLQNFGEELEGITFSVNRADWLTNKWMKDHNMSELEVEDEIIFWECGQQQ